MGNSDALTELQRPSLSRGEENMSAHPPAHPFNVADAFLKSFGGGSKYLESLEAQPWVSAALGQGVGLGPGAYLCQGDSHLFLPFNSIGGKERIRGKFKTVLRNRRF